ncbi:MAG: ABC transporter permease [Tepidisphaeraceae bacterium]
MRHSSLLLPAISLCRRELVRFVRQPNRVIGALATPVVFWLLIGGGMGRSFSGDHSGRGYIEYFFPGTLVMILLFTAIFSTISIIEDRREGFLQSVLVAPAPRMALVLGKVLGGTILATGQALIFLLLAPTVGIRPSATGVILTFCFMLTIAFALTGLGVCIAWRMTSTQGFHAIMNLALMPMWFLSGALFPASGATRGLGWIMALNPLTYGLAGVRRALYLHQTPESASLPSLTTCAVVTLAFAAAMLGLASTVAGSRAAAEAH